MVRPRWYPRDRLLLQLRQPLERRLCYSQGRQCLP